MRELNIGDVIQVPVSHTDRMRNFVIDRITPTQYVCGSKRFSKRDLGIVGAKYPQETRGYFLEVPEVRGTKMQVTTDHVMARNFTKHKGDVYAVIARVPDSTTEYAVRHVRAGDDAVEALTRSIELNHYGFGVDPFICRLEAYGRVNDLFILMPLCATRPLVEVTISSPRVKHPSGKGWIYFNLPEGYDATKPYDLYCIDDAMDLQGDYYALEFGTGENEIINLTLPIRVYGVDMMWGGVRREKVCICRHPDLDECDDDDDGFKPPRICQPIEPWLQIDNDEDLYEYLYS